MDAPGFRYDDYIDDEYEDEAAEDVMDTEDVSETEEPADNMEE